MKNILLVEDDPFLIDIYRTKLTESGFSVDLADDGEEVLKKLKEKNFDLMILDIVLPNLDGWEVMEKVKKDPETKDLKVIILSNLGQKEEVEKGMRLGADKYLIKAHYTPSQVVEELKEIIQ